MSKPFTELPELMVYLNRFLEPQDLLKCCRDPVARSETHMDALSDLVKSKDKNKDHGWLMHVFRKYRRHIRNLNVHWPLILEAVSQAAKREPNDGADESCDFLCLTSLTMDIRSDRSTPFYGDRGQPASMRPMPKITMSPTLYPGVIQEQDFKQGPCYGLTVKAQTEALENGWALTQHYWHLLMVSSGLRSVTFKMAGYLQWATSSAEVQFRALTHMKGLERIMGYTFPDLSTMLRFISLIPTLKTMGTGCSNMEFPPYAQPSSPLRSSMTELTMQMNITINTVLDLITLLPNLSKLQLFSVANHTDPALHVGPGQFVSNPTFVQERIRSRNPAIFAKFRELEIHKVDDYRTLLAHIPEHVEITLCDDTELPDPDLWNRFGVFTSSTPLYNERSGQSITPAKSAINGFFIKSHRLRIFDSIDRYLVVDEMLRRPWVCMGLEQLTCQILGVTRLKKREEAFIQKQIANLDPSTPSSSSSSSSSSSLPRSMLLRLPLLLSKLDKLSGPEKEAVQKLKKSLEQHHRVYDQLAKLTKLKILDLGYENRDPWSYQTGERYRGVGGKVYLRYREEPVFDTLELSLTSGLERLEGLKEMQTIGFECTNHRVGEAELEWMAKTWRKLKCMRGLQTEIMPNIEPSLERKALRTYMQRVRPDIEHRSLFTEEMLFHAGAI
ncbi:hypothetical protein BG004_005028 [Podila humilis]|nr:hypothetical protein BG004_005028 [Podila humilis]